MFLHALETTQEYNYVEIVHVVNKKPAMYDCNLNKERFMFLLNAVSRKCKLKYFSKKTKRYRINEQFMEVFNDDVKVYKQECLSNLYDRGFLCLYYKRDKLPYHQFPSTMNIHEIVYIQKLTYRLHNRLFLNFEIHKRMDGLQRFKIYFNYNHDKSSEINNIREILQEYVTMLQSL